MRTSIAVALVALLGVVAGISAAWVRLERSRWNRNPIREGAQASRVPSLEGNHGDLRPKVVVDSEAYDFDVMDEEATGSHDFAFRNEGTAPLRLAQGESTCGCTLSKLKRALVPPGESANVTVEWSPEGRFGPFREGVTITTNDPQWPQVGLTVTGRITTAVRPDPDPLIFSRVMAGETAHGTVRLFGYLTEPLEITGYHVANPKTQAEFAVAWTPLSAEELAKEEDATSGYSAEVTVKPGLPLGPFRQTIHFETNLADHPVIDVVVKGTVGGEISIVGPGWDEEQGILFIGTVSRREGAERTLRIFVRGPHRKEVKFKLAEVVPDLLDVDEEALSQGVDLLGGAVTQTLLKIRIPPGSGPANHLGSQQGRLGRIAIETTDPKVPRLMVYVKFAVAD